MADGDETESGPTCSRCGERPAGPGRILCTECRGVLERPVGEYWARQSGSADA